MATLADKPETIGESERKLNRAKIGEIKSSTGNDAADVEGIYPEELSEAAKSPDMS